MSDLNRAAAERVHYTDPRVRELAEGRWRLKTGGSRAEWLVLGKDNPEALIEEARDWIRAAVATGILPLPDREGDDLYEEMKARRPDLYGSAESV
jgi:hypothetical protein